jgi:hypothetical protein
MEQKKTYYGYKPKEDNLVKLAQYLRVKGALSNDKNAVNDKVTKLSTNKVLKNKRF